MLGLNLGGKGGLNLGLNLGLDLKVATPEVQSKLEACIDDVNAQLSAGFSGFKAVKYHSETAAEASAETCYTIVAQSECGTRHFTIVLLEAAAEAGGQLTVKSATEVQASSC